MPKHIWCTWGLLKRLSKPALNKPDVLWNKHAWTDLIFDVLEVTELYSISWVVFGSQGTSHSFGRVFVLNQSAKQNDENDLQQKVELCKGFVLPSNLKRRFIATLLFLPHTDWCYCLIEFETLLFLIELSFILWTKEAFLLSNFHNSATQRTSIKCMHHCKMKW